jgi:hypothetical protein
MEMFESSGRIGDDSQKKLCGMIRMSPGFISTLAETSAAPDQILQAHRILSASRTATQNRRAVASSEVGQASHGDHDVEQRHLLAVGERLRLGRLADHPDLLAVGPDEARNDDRDDGVANVLAEQLFDVAGDLIRVLVLCDQFIDQRSRQLAVGSHGNRHREFRISPDDDV